MSLQEGHTVTVRFYDCNVIVNTGKTASLRKSLQQADRTHLPNGEHSAVPRILSTTFGMLPADALESWQVANSEIILLRTNRNLMGPYGIRSGDTRNRMKSRRALYGYGTVYHKLYHMAAIYGYGGDPESKFKTSGNHGS
ncbi:hypothetical protein K438DRAFT_1765500 [Mycena galopus ATCC 62051]|nr:hypothetical protein K438DRAFT_1765500 [Mycena galopus ATCC 62051]